MKKRKKKNKLITKLADLRIYFHIAFGVAIYLIVNYYQISLWWVVGFGSAIGIIWGKVFCRWMCPIGIMMEFMMKISPDDSLKNMYQYHKIGCPIAWISGFLNKVSFYKIRINQDTCVDCGKCDDACYMPAMEDQKFSLYKPDMVNPGDDYSCSKCLLCVAKCPNGSLSYTSAIPSLKIKNKF